MGNHIWTLGSKPRKHNCQAKDTSEEEEEEEAPCNLHCTIPCPNGEASQGGDSGRGFNIQNLIGLSEDKAQYNAITVSLCPSCHGMTSLLAFLISFPLCLCPRPISITFQLHLTLSACLLLPPLQL